MPKIKPTPPKKARKESKKHAFFNFKKNQFSKLARDYHDEIYHLTLDLRRINRYVQKSGLLCHQQISFINKRLTHLLSANGQTCFEETLYHLENFSFRLSAYRDKVLQFVNQALRIGFDEKQRGLLGIIQNNRLVKESHLDTELRKFDTDKDFKSTIEQRNRFAHRRYYKAEETGYDALLRPVTEPAADRQENMRLWKQNIKNKISQADRVVLKAMDLNDRLMEKVNRYIKE